MKNLASKFKIFIKDKILLGQINKFLYAPQRPIGFAEMNEPKRKIKIYEVIPETRSVAEYNKDLLEVATIPEIKGFKPEVTLNAAYVADIYQGRFMTDSSDVAIMSSDRALLHYFSVHYEIDSKLRAYGSSRQEQNNLYRQRYYYPPKKIKGTVLNMQIGGANNFYSHFIWDMLPGYNLVERAGLISEIDFFYFPSIDFRFQKEILEALKINIEKVITNKDTQHFIADRLITFTHPNHQFHTPLWIIDFLRSNFLKMVKPDTNQFSKLLISRQDSGFGRHIINEDDIFAKLEPLGFKRIISSDYSFLEQVKILSSADIVITVHGSGMMNLIFCKPKTAVIEIFTDDYINPDMALLAQRNNLKYFFIITAGIKLKNDKKGVYSNLVIDEKVLFQKLKEIE